MITPWLRRAYSRAEPSMARSQVRGELALHSEMTTVFSSRKSSPKARAAISTESAARWGAVTDPMNGLSE